MQPILLPVSYINVFPIFADLLNWESWLILFFETWMSFSVTNRTYNQVVRENTHEMNKSQEKLAVKIVL